MVFVVAGGIGLLRQCVQQATLPSACTSAVAALAGVRYYHVARLASRGVISLSGPESVQFLQGMTTNDVKPLEQPGEAAALDKQHMPAGAGPIYTVLLTAKGKYLHDLFAYSLPGEEQQLLLDVDAAGVCSAVSWLNKYKLRRKLQIADASSQYSVWAAFEGNLRAGGAGQWRQDPRLPDLGLRGIFDAQQLPPPPAAADGSSSRKQQAAGMSVVGEELFQRWRCQHGVAEGDKDMPTGEVAPLECNLDALNGISYSKGCYIGQERNSYTHYRGIIRKRMMPVMLPGLDQQSRLPCPLPITASGQASSSSRAASVGTLTNHIGDVGMAYIRLTPALFPSTKLRVVVGDQELQVVPKRPEWWPSEWGKEEAGKVNQQPGMSNSQQ